MSCWKCTTVWAMEAADRGRLYAFHFHVLRGILEKTATFFGNDDFGVCIHGLDDDELYARALNLMRHETYSLTTTINC